MSAYIVTERKSSKKFKRYNLFWPNIADPIAIERTMIQRGGQWTNSIDEQVGNGLFYHYRRFQELLWPDKIWRKGPFVNYWAEKCLEVYLNHTYVGVMGCAACVRGDTKIYDPTNGEEPTIEYLLQNNIAPTVLTTNGPELATVPFFKGKKELFEVKLKSGHSFVGTSEHRVLRANGEFCRVSELTCGDLLLRVEPYLLRSTSERIPLVPQQGVHRSIQKAEDFQFDYPACSCSYDAPPHPLSMACPESLTSPIYAQEHTYMTEPLSWDDRGNESRHIHYYQRPFHQSSSRFSLHGILERKPYPLHNVLKMGERAFPHHQLPSQSVLSNIPQTPFSEQVHDYVHTQNEYANKISWNSSWGAPSEVSSIKYVGIDKYYDLTVPIAGHYYAQGMIHHNSGKSSSFGSNALTDWYCFPDCTTILVTSTDLKSLELRIWGMIKAFHKSAKEKCSWMPGYLIEGKQMLIQDPRAESAEGRDFKNGIMAVPVKKGNQYVGLGSMIGIHNKRVRLIGDELQLMPRAFLDSTANLSKCEDFKLCGLGNPNETTNAHGVLCEPSPELGGWEGGIDQTPLTKTWKTRFPNGICLQLPGSDSPNLKAGDDEEVPFAFLITRQQLHDDARMWGVDDWHYKMMDEGMMPKGQGSRRVLTRQKCIQFGAFKPPVWRDTRRTKIAFLDAAYRGVGGDRCVFGELQFGYEPMQINGTDLVSSMINHTDIAEPNAKIIALIDITTIPISSDTGSEASEDQIVKFCRKECNARGIPAGNLYYDAGMRTSLVMAFSREWSTDCNSVDFGGRPSEDMVSSEIRTPACDYYSKFVTELWFSVAYAVESGQFRGMTEEVCTEFCQREWKLVSGNRMEVETKAEMKLKTGRSPDLADAVAVGLHGARKRGFIIAKLRSPEEYEGPSEAWKIAARAKAKKLATSGQLNFAA